MLRFDPFRDLDRLTGDAGRRSPSIMPFDAVRDDDEVMIYIDVPGVAADDLEVSVEKNELTIRAERRWSDEGKRVVASERPQGTFTRQLMLSDALDLDALQAELAEGVLTLRIPVDESSKQRRIDVTHGGGRTAIEASGEEHESS